MTTPGNVSMGKRVAVGRCPTRTWRVDPDTLRISGMADGLEAMRQAVEILLSVKRFRWQIYSPRVGHEIGPLEGDSGAAAVRLRSAVEAALLADDRVTGVDGYQFWQEEDAVRMTCRVHTVFGEMETEVQV